LERLKSLLLIDPELNEEKRKQLLRPEGISGNIRFRDVTFGYKNETPVLKNVEMEIPNNSVTAIMGPTGGGKTTIVNLILRFYTPWHGSVEIDGLDTRDIDPYYLREQIAVVSQDIFLFNGTIRENIRYGRPGATDPEVYEAAMKAGLHDEIMSMPDGYNTVTGERGLNLSGGQRQRVSIARAVLQKPKILIFDEPTSSLDAETEEKIKASLKGLFRGRTVIIISHRNSLLDLADRVYRVEGGKVWRDR
ncbi:MAG: ATP-binding cassette domain-containing protein, partial [Nitrospirae bacterium]